MTLRTRFRWSAIGLALAAVAVAVSLSAPASGASTAKGDLNCDDFPSQAAAQNNLDNNPSDPNGLDADNDGTLGLYNPAAVMRPPRKA